MHTALLVFASAPINRTFPVSSSLCVTGLETPIHFCPTCAINPIQPLIVVGRWSGSVFLPGAVYILDSNRHPAQISGTQNLLLDGATICDLTTPYLAAIRYTSLLLSTAFAEFNLQEMDCYAQVFSSLEVKAWSKNLIPGITFKSCRKNIFAALNESDISSEVAFRLIQGINGAGEKAPRKVQTVEVNWEGYPLVERV